MSAIRGELVFHDLSKPIDVGLTDKVTTSRCDNRTIDDEIAEAAELDNSEERPNSRVSVFER